jgi:hypothetical protein
MSLTPPSLFPNWATDDQVDPVSQQNNVLLPPPEKQQFGFARLEFPPRNWFNYLFRTINNWIMYLAQQAGLSATVDGSGSSPVVNVVTGGMASISVVDTASTAKYYEGIVYVPPGYSSGTLTFNTTSSSSLTVSAITAAGQVTIGGGTGPYIVNVTMYNIP